MNLGNCPRLVKRNITGTWFRTVDSKHVSDGILARHTPSIISRFSAGSRSDPPYEILYFSDDGKVSQDETKALIGELTKPRTSTALRTDPITTIPVQVDVRDIADLTHPDQADLIQTNAQELTGDWEAYQQRTRPYGCTSSTHTGVAPSQQLGAALFGCGQFQGFITFSAIKADHATLVLFPERLLHSPSTVWYTYHDSLGVEHRVQIP